MTFLFKLLEMSVATRWHRVFRKFSLEPTLRASAPLRVWIPLFAHRVLEVKPA